MNFYNLLYQSISEENEIDTLENNLSTCLITNEPLSEGNITLYCGHSFNYEPLYKEVKQQKIHKNMNEIRIIRKFELMCPYCRNIQKGLLPPHPNFEFIYGVNGPNHMYTKKCKYELKSGPRKGTLCNSMCHEDYCNRCKAKIERKKQKEIKKKEKPLCQIVLKSGKRKGELCMNTVKCGLYCGRHKNREINKANNNPEQKENQKEKQKKKN